MAVSAGRSLCTYINDTFGVFKLAGLNSREANLHSIE